VLQGPWPGLPGSHRCVRHGAAPWLPGAGARRPALGRAGDRFAGNLTIPGWSRGQEDLARSWPRRRHGGGFIALVISKGKLEKQRGGGIRVCPPAFEGLRGQRSGLTASLTAASSWIFVYKPAGGGACPRPSRPWRRYRRVLVQEYALFSTGSTPWPTLPISGFSAALAASGHSTTTSPCLRRQPPAGESSTGDVPPA